VGNTPQHDDMTCLLLKERLGELPGIRSRDIGGTRARLFPASRCKPYPAEIRLCCLPVEEGRALSITFVLIGAAPFACTTSVAVTLAAEGSGSPSARIVTQWKPRTVRVKICNLC